MTYLKSLLCNSNPDFTTSQRHGHTPEKGDRRIAQSVADRWSLEIAMYTPDGTLVATVKPGDDSLPANFDFDLFERALVDQRYCARDVAGLMTASEAMGRSDVLDLLGQDFDFDTLTWS